MKIIKNILWRVCLLFIVLSLKQSFAYNWPFRENGVDTIEQKIRQTVGAYRTGTPPDFIEELTFVQMIPQIKR